VTPSLSGDARGECRGELLGQSRRGALTDAGRLALDAHLGACASCRLARDVLADFDQVDVVDIRDGARVRALVDAARRHAAGPGGRRHGRSRPGLRAAAAAAALAIFGGSASAAVWWWRRPAPPAPEVRAPRAAVARGATTGRGTGRAATLAPAVTEASAASPGVVEPPPAIAPAPAAAAIVPRHRSAARAAGPTDDGARASAGALLAAAGRARGEGERDRAAALYRQLQREFPGTPEALVSSVPLGRLLLDAGAARAALAAFDGYLRDAPRGPLVAEALYGKGRALELLNEHEDERRTWERLLAEQAGSAYVPHAQRRLAALK